MGQYKVPQDVEAEDKIIGMLTLKQFIYAVIGVAYGLLTFQLFKKVLLLFVIVGVPPTFMMLMLGLYQREGQPFEAYFLALVNYWFKPRTRIWIKEDLAEVFKIEQPKPKPEEAHRDPREVRGQLEKLAQIVDTRGWAVKDPELQEPGQHPVIDLNDRLTTAEITLPTPTIQPEVELADDILDLDNNPSARNLGTLIENTEKTIHEEIMERIRQQPPTPQVASPESRVTSPNVDSIPAQNQPQVASPLPVPSDELRVTSSTNNVAPTPVAAPNSPLTTTQPSQLTTPDSYVSSVSEMPVSSVSEMTTNPIADILKRAMETPDLKLSQVSQIAAQAQAGTPSEMVEGQAVALRTEPPQN